MLQLKDLMIGKVDGKHEYLTPIAQRNDHVFDAFVLPEGVDASRLNNTDVHFVEGYRGTGKTSLLRWDARCNRLAGVTTEFVLFKTDLTEAQRMQLSNEVGVTWVDTDPKVMEISQDFKDAWTWFILHKIGELVSQEESAKAAAPVTRFLKLLGLYGDSPYKKVLGFLPRIEGAAIKIRANLGFFEAELAGDFKKSGEVGETTLGALNRKERLKNLTVSA